MLTRLLPRLRRRRLMMMATGGDSFLLRDTFTDANGTALTAHTMDVGGGWRADAGTAQISSNQGAPATLGGGRCVQSADAGRADYRLSGKIKPAASSLSVGFVVRLVDGSNYWLVYVSADSFVIYEITTGGFTSRAIQSGLTNSPGVEHTIEVTVSGNTITATLDGTTTISYASATAHNTATRAGVYADTTTNMRWDDFEVTP